jgi:hypothetical protein
LSVHAAPRPAGSGVHAWVDGLQARSAQQSFPLLHAWPSWLHVGVGWQVFDEDPHTSPLQQASVAHDAPCAAQPGDCVHCPPAQLWPAAHA